MEMSLLSDTLGGITMSTPGLWVRERFPVLYEGGEAKAVLVDVATFNQIELILDNLLNREVEPEDAILAASPALRQLAALAQQEKPSANWQQELDEL
jgi:hypothetical protein